MIISKYPLRNGSGYNCPEIIGYNLTLRITQNYREKIKVFLGDSVSLWYIGS
jgi:hypothetical protein